MTQRVAIPLTEEERKLLKQVADNIGESQAYAAKMILLQYLMQKERKYL